MKGATTSQIFSFLLFASAASSHKAELPREISNALPLGGIPLFDILGRQSCADEQVCGSICCRPPSICLESAIGVCSNPADDTPNAPACADSGFSVCPNKEEACCPTGQWCGANSDVCVACSEGKFLCEDDSSCCENGYTCDTANKECIHPDNISKSSSERSSTSAATATEKSASITETSSTSGTSTAPAATTTPSKGTHLETEYYAIMSWALFFGLVGDILFG